MSNSEKSVFSLITSYLAGPGNDNDDNNNNNDNINNNNNNNNNTIDSEVLDTDYSSIDSEIDNLDVLRSSNESGEDSVSEDSTSKDFTNITVRSKLLDIDSYDLEEDARKDSEELILNEDTNRLVLKPIDPNFSDIWNLYKTQEAAHWTAESVDISSDRFDFESLDEDIQEFIKMTLAFFAGADTIVNINIAQNLSKIQVKEAIVTYNFQTMMENVHSEVYSNMLTGIIADETERKKLVNAFEEVESIKRMFKWAEEWTNSNRRIGFSIFAFTVFEGLFFSSAFASIYWLKNHIGKNQMQGFTKSNEYIARDEGMHTNFGCLMYSYVKHRLSVEEAEMLMTEAVDIAKQFNHDAIKVKLIGMNENLMSEYIEYVADRLMVYLGYEKIYNTNIPAALAFMENIGINNKNNFFEGRTTDYQKAHNKNNKDHEFKILEDY